MLAVGQISHHEPLRGHGHHLFEAQARCAFRHFMNLLNRAVFGNAARRYGKRLRVIAVLEKGLNSPWHYHAAIEPPGHIDRRPI